MPSSSRYSPSVGCRAPVATRPRYSWQSKRASSFRDPPVEGDGERDEDEEDAQAPGQGLPAFGAQGPVEEEGSDGVYDQGESE